MFGPGETLNLPWEYNIIMDLKEIGFGPYTGLIWLRIGTGGWIL
jgi:hypothetical protein